MANYSGSISAYAISPATGSLTTISGSPFPTDPGASASKIIGTNSVTVDPTGRFVYAANNQGNGISAYAIDPTTGALTLIPGSPFAAGNVPMSVRVEPSGKFAYAINMYSNDIWAYSIDGATGALTPVAGSPFATGGTYPTVYPTGLAIDPSGKFAYVANATNGGSSTIAGFAIDPGTGALSPLAGSPFAAGPNTYSVAVHPSGQFLFVGSNDVSVYAIDPKAGSLTPVAGSPFTSIGAVGGTYTFGFAD
jgi:6-phosphogluconolactonase (cycloisomerase 2 family)